MLQLATVQAARRSWSCCPLIAILFAAEPTACRLHSNSQKNLPPVDHAPARSRSYLQPFKLQVADYPAVPLSTIQTVLIRAIIIESLIFTTTNRLSSPETFLSYLPYMTAFPDHQCPTTIAILADRRRLTDNGTLVRERQLSSDYHQHSDASLTYIPF